MNPPEDDWATIPQGPPQPPPNIFHVLTPDAHVEPVDVDLMTLVIDQWRGVRNGAGGALEGEGEGIYSNTLGYTYAGDYTDSLTHGEGCYTWDDGVQYQGVVERNALTGSGSYTFANGDTYTGEVHDGMRHGEGTYTRKGTGEAYTGQWEHGVKSGYGKMVYGVPRRGITSYYEGEWVNGERHGHGTMVYKSGSTYTGGWAHGKREGTGTMRWMKNSVATMQYKGVWVDGEMEGDGVYEYFQTEDSNAAEPTRAVSPLTSGEAAQGDVPATNSPLLNTSTGGTGGGSGAASKRPPLAGGAAAGATPRATSPPAPVAFGATTSNGPGTLAARTVAITSPSGTGAAGARRLGTPDAPLVVNSYKGAFKQSKRSGRGQFIYHDGARYVGLWVDNAKHGQGTFTFACGTMYEGEFKGGTPAHALPPPGQDKPALTRHIPLNIDDILIGAISSTLQQSSQGDVQKVLDRIDALMSRHYSDLQNLFHHYSSLRLDQEQRGHARTALSMLQFWRFVKDFGLVGNGLTIAEIDRIFLKFQQADAPMRRPSPLKTARVKNDGSFRSRKNGSGEGGYAGDAASVAGTAAGQETPGTKSLRVSREGSMKSLRAIQAVSGGPSPAVRSTASARNMKATVAAEPTTVSPAAQTAGGDSGGAADAAAPADSVRQQAPSEVPAPHAMPPGARTGPRPSLGGVTSKSMRSARTDRTVGLPSSRGDDRHAIKPTAYHVAPNVHASDRCMYFRDFAEAIVRIAHARYRDGVALSLADKLALCLERDLNPNSQANSTNPAAASFLKASMEMNDTIAQHQDLLRRIFAAYSTKSYRGLALHRKRPRNDVVLTVRQFLILLRDSQIYDKTAFPMRRALDLFDAPVPLSVPAPPAPPAAPPSVLTPMRSSKHLTTSSGVLMTSDGTAGTGGGLVPHPPPSDRASRVGTVSPSPQFEGTATIGTVGSQGGMSPRSLGRISDEQWCSASQVDAHGICDAQEAEERRAQRQQALELISRGPYDFNLHTAMTVDQEMVYEEFVEALIKVAAIKGGAAGATAEKSKSEHFEKLVSTHLAPLESPEATSALQVSME